MRRGRLLLALLRTRLVPLLSEPTGLATRVLLSGLLALLAPGVPGRLPGRRSWLALLWVRPVPSRVLLWRL